MSLGTLSKLDVAANNPLLVDAYVARAGFAGKVFVEIIDPELTTNNVVWSNTQAKDFTPGSNYVVLPFHPANDAGATAADSKAYYILASFTDSAGNLIDQAMESCVFSNDPFSSGVAGSQVSRATSHTGVIAGEARSGSIHLTNTGSETFEVLLQPSSDRITFSHSGGMVRVAPGASVTVFFQIATDGLALGTHPFTIGLSSNDAALQGTSIPVSVQVTSVGTFANSVSVSAVADFPWAWNVAVQGPQAPNATRVFVLPAGMNLTGVLPLVAYRLGETLGYGENLKLTPTILRKSSQSATAYSLNLPEAVPAAQTKTFTTEFGLQGTLASDTCTINVPVDATGFDSVSLDLFVLDNQGVVIAEPNLTVTVQDDSPSVTTIAVEQADIDEHRRFRIHSGPVERAGATGTVNIPVKIDAVGASGLKVVVCGLSYVDTAEPDLSLATLGTVEAMPADGFAAGDLVTFRANLENHGAAPARYFTVAFYDGNPDEGGAYLASVFVDQEFAAYDSGTGTPGTKTVTAQWTVKGAAGYHTIYAVVDPGNDLAEEDEDNNVASSAAGAELLISYWTEVAVDCGNASGGDADLAYTTPRGYGFESGDAYTWGDGTGDTSLETARFAFGGELVYRFDNVSPVYAYNLDLSFYRPDGLPSEYQVYADDRLLKVFTANTEGGPTEEQFVVDLNQNGMGNSAFATGYIPAEVLEDESVRIRILGVGNQPVACSHIQLKRGARIFIDCGGLGTVLTGAPADPAYTDGYADVATGIRYGHAKNSPASLSFPYRNGTESRDTLRYAPAGRVGYMFSSVDPASKYVLRPTVSGASGTFYTFELDSAPAGLPVALSDLPTTHNLLVSDSQIADGQMLFTIARTNNLGGSVAGSTAIIDLELNEFTAAQQMRMDSDLDGMPDWYELGFVGEPSPPNVRIADAVVDSDGDGIPNIDEYEAGTDPTSSNSVFGVSNFEVKTSQGLVELKWPCETGRSYTVQWSSDLSEWLTLIGGIPASVTGQCAVSAALPEADRCFYRIQVERIYR